MIFDDSIKTLIEAAYESRHDVFLSLEGFDPGCFSGCGVKTAVLLPGAFYCGKDFLFSDIRNKFTENLTFCPNLIFADVRYAALEEFRSFLCRNCFSRIVLPFAELADPAEYGFRQAYSWTGEIKAESSAFIQTVCLFSEKPHDTDKFLRLYNCKNTVFAGEDIFPSVRAIKTGSRKAAYYMLASEAERYAWKKVIIYFTTRSQAAAFGMFLRKRGTDFSYYDGSLTQKQAERQADNFRTGRTSVMLATKSFIPSALFIKADRVIYSGVPYSVSHLLRCTSSLEKPEILAVYCDDDFILNEKISRSFSALTEDKDMIECRHKALLHIKKILSKA